MRSMVDIAASREAFRDNIILNIGIVRKSNIIADGLRKKMNQSAPRKLLYDLWISVEPEQ